MTLLIDDIRNLEADKVARTFTEGIIALVSQKWDLLLLDHDLSSYVDGVEKTGYDIMLFLERNPEYLPGKIEIVSANPVGRRNMQVVIDQLYGEKR